MFKRLLISLAILTGLAFPVHAAGTLPGFSLTPQFDAHGNVAPGCKLYVIQAGTTSTPQNSYQDSGLTNALPNPLECDASGRLPQFYLADGQIKVRLTDKDGGQIFVGDNLLVIGPSSGGGGGGGDVDPTTIFETGAIKAKYGTGSLSGWVRMNGRTIGSATSGATERANSDTQALFEYLWGADSNLAVSSGRGASAAADWSANKTIALPDARGRALAALDDMGNSAAGRLTTDFFGTSATVLGAAGGSEKHTLTKAELPVVTPTATSVFTPAGTTFMQRSATAAFNVGADVTIRTSSVDGIPTGTVATTIAPFGSGDAHAIASPMLLVTIYVKL